MRERKLKQKPEDTIVAGSSNATQGIADFDFDKGQGGSIDKPKQERDEGMYTVHNIYMYGSPQRIYLHVHVLKIKNKFHATTIPYTVNSVHYCMY